MSRIGFIGTGHIAAPMARALARDGHQVIVSGRNAEVAAALAADFANITMADNQAVVDGADIVFLCLRPPVAPAVLSELEFRADHQVVSVMSGVSMDALQGLCAPATDICMSIPLGYLEAGGCPLAVFPHGDVLSPLFGAANPIIPVASEAALNQHFAICAFVPGVLDLMATAAGWLGDKTGDQDAAAHYTAQIVAGFLAAMPREKAGRLEYERDALATEGTLSLQMVSGLRTRADGDAHDALIAALDGIKERLERA